LYGEIPIEKTQPFIHEPFTLLAIFETSSGVPQVTNNKQSQVKIIIVRI
jgi:hypothetical protein